MSPRTPVKDMKDYYKSKKSVRSSRKFSSPPVPDTLEDEVGAVLAALRSNAPSHLPGRDAQLEKIDQFLKDNLQGKQSRWIYIYGAPGHGKTASVKMITNQSHIKNKMKAVYVDCRKISIASDVYEAIISSLDSKHKRISKTENLAKIEEFLRRSKKPVLLILDEMDRLKTTNNSVIYSLLDLLSTTSPGKITIIGIGNTQNFIDTLPLVRNNDALEPTLIEFGSYSKDHIKEILTERLKSVSLQRLVFSETAIELLAAKTEVFGDIRISLALAAAIVENVSDKSVEDEICKVDPLSVISAYKSKFSTGGNTPEEKDAIDSLPLPQKLILCAVLLTLKKNICSVKDLTLTHVYNQYKDISAKKGVEKLPNSEFLYACRMIDQQGFFNRKRSSKKSISWDDKILLKSDQTELLNKLKTKPMLNDIFPN